MVEFTKYQGLGNDFVVIDLRKASSAISVLVQDPASVIALCDRQFGIGGDGVLAILPPSTDQAHARMRVLNADGSEAEMCGNGLRCVAKHLFDIDKPGSTQLRIETGAGILECQIEVVHGQAHSVQVAMGAPQLAHQAIPVSLTPVDGRCIEQSVLDLPLPVTCVSMGNPHAIMFVADRAEAHARALADGPRIETHPVFPRRTNVEFAAMRADGEIDLIVWERGCGITLACGTGASATAVAACLTGRAPTGQALAVHLLGGTLRITVAPTYDMVWMNGPCARVFAGVVDIHEVLRAQRPRSSSQRT